MKVSADNPLASAPARESSAVVSPRRRPAAALRKPILRGVVMVAYLAVLFLIWELAARASSLPSFILPPASDVARQFVDSFGLLLRNSWVTVLESLIGLGSAIVIGVAIALLLAYWEWARTTVFPSMVIFESIPKVALAPLVVVWFGLGTSSKVAMVIMLCVFPIALSTLRGLTTIDVDYLDLMSTLHAKRWQVFLRVRLPFSIPFLFTGIKIAVPLAMIGAVIGEFVAAQHGLGYLILSDSQSLQTDKSLAAIALVTFWSVLFFQIVAYAERTVLRLFPVAQTG